MLTEQKPGGQKNTITMLDGVRGCAILIVIIFHVNWTNRNILTIVDWHKDPLAASIALAGGTGVTLFFVLSGFLLFLPYSKALLTAGRWPLARTFYVRRIMRIVPGYYISLIALILLTAPQYLQSQNLKALLLFLTFFMDSSAHTFRKLNGPYWTLAVEWQFYLILPLLALGILMLVKRVRLEKRLHAVTLCLLGIMIISMAVRYEGDYLVIHPTTIFLVSHGVTRILLFFGYGLSGKYIEEFAVGMLGALVYVYTQNISPEGILANKLRQLSLWLWGVGILILTFSAIWHLRSAPGSNAWPLLNPIMPYFYWLSEFILSIGYLFCIMAILFGPRELQRLFNWKPLRWIGLISYGLYIWHLPFIMLFEVQVVPRLPKMNRYLLYGLHWVWIAVVLIPFCILYYLYVEKPGIKIGDLWRKSIEGRRRARLQTKEVPVVPEQLELVSTQPGRLTQTIDK
ncbi:acyltransferase [Dictyobacter alpinus]|uniref:Acyltransferase n=1 Tax=Dictyobacter alpinus TaxID=2014873 RepID=A0A402BKF3_9CHLR|nr:acyltransferase [Dictyobacter alpinus]GCE31819.1 acyltransferase [Dictyobacter alpinus]